MVIALAQLNYQVGDFEENSAKIIDTIQRAQQQGADLIVFAELAIGGYPAKDLLLQRPFLDACQASLQAIAEHCHGITCIIGAPTANPKATGKPLFNSAVVLADGLVQHTVNKSLIPDYDVFDEYRYFQPAEENSTFTIAGKKIALTICEDLWNIPGKQLYSGDPISALQKESADLLINIAASPFAIGQFEERFQVLSTQAVAMDSPVVYVNQIGAHTDIIFDGRSMVIDAAGNLVDVLHFAAEDLRLYQLSDKQLQPLQPAVQQTQPSEIALIHRCLILGIQDYFHKSGFKKAVLGLSGGLDSALVAALACEALGPENVLSVLLPSAYSSDHSIQDALDLVKNTGCAHQIIPISNIVSSFEQTLEPAFAETSPGIAEENIQARTRGTLLMALSNKFGHILLNTSNKSEAAVGYGTLYGDMAGALSVIGDVYKTQAYALAHYINRDREIIPRNTIEKPPSAELRPGQKDSDSLPDYELLDAILYQHIENNKPAADLEALGFDPDLVGRIVSLINRAEFKRFQAPPILRVSRKAFGAGRAMPLVAKYPL